MGTGKDEKIRIMYEDWILENIQARVQHIIQRIGIVKRLVQRSVPLEIFLKDILSLCKDICRIRSIFYDENLISCRRFVVG